MQYESWRISFQSSEQCARALFDEVCSLQSRVAELEKDAARYRVARRVISLHDLYSAADSTEDYSREVDMLIDRLMGSEA